MDMITLAMAKAYSDSKGGYAEQNVFTFNGNPEGRVPAFEGLVKISDKTPAAETIVRVRGKYRNQLLDIGKADCTINNQEAFSFIESAGLTVAFVVYREDVAFEKGLYVACDPSDGSHVSYIEFTETIHPIDPKFLPGVCLPVVEITSAEYPGSSAVELSAEESAKLTAAAETGLPVIVKCKVDIFTVTIQLIAIVNEGVLFYVSSVNNPEFTFSPGENGWVMGG